MTVPVMVITAARGLTPPERLSWIAWAWSSLLVRLGHPSRRTVCRWHARAWHGGSVGVSGCVSCRLRHGWACRADAVTGHIRWTRQRRDFWRTSPTSRPMASAVASDLEAIPRRAQTRIHDELNDFLRIPSVSATQRARTGCTTGG